MGFATATATATATAIATATTTATATAAIPPLPPNTTITANTANTATTAKVTNPTNPISTNPTRYEHIYMIDKTAHVWYYTLDEETKDLLCVVLIGMIYRVIAYIAMISFNKEKQS